MLVAFGPGRHFGPIEVWRQVAKWSRDAGALARFGEVGIANVDGSLAGGAGHGGGRRIATRTPLGGGGGGTQRDRRGAAGRPAPPRRRREKRGSRPAGALLPEPGLDGRCGRAQRGSGRQCPLLRPGHRRGGRGGGWRGRPLRSAFVASAVTTPPRSSSFSVTFRRPWRRRPGCWARKRSSALRPTFPIWVTSRSASRGCYVAERFLIDRILERGSLSVHFQPVLDLRPPRPRRTIWRP